MKRLLILAAAVLAFAAPSFATNVTTLDAPAGGGWKIVRDPANRGMIDRWQRAIPRGAVDIRVPGTLQEAFPNYWGLVWYYRSLKNIKKRDDARYLLRFRMAAYKATVYMNGVELGSHEDSEEIFTVDATEAVKDGENLIAVRLLCPDIVEIDGINTYEIPGRGKGRGMYNYGGLLDSVEFLETPRVRMTDIRLIPDAARGCVEVRGRTDNPTGETRKGKITFRVMPAHEGEVCDETAVNITAAPGKSDFSLMLYVKNRKLWDIDDPNLYSVSGESDFDGGSFKDSYSSNIGFRVFEYKDGFFKLNGRRIFLKCNHCDEMSPVGLTVPLNKETTRRDMMNFKTMGFNCVRFIFGLHHSYILDLADELGLMIYDEALASWQLGYNMPNPEPKVPAMVPRWEYSTLNMIRRDRNHPSVVIWGMLNENYSDVFYRRALTFLPEVRAEDDSRFVLLNSGNFHLTDFVVPLTGDIKMGSPLSVPHIHKNPSTEILTNADTHLPPGRIQMHPAPEKDCSVKFTAPTSGRYDIRARFTGICDRPTSSEPMIYVKGAKVFDDFINLNGKGNECAYEGSFDLEEGDLVFVNVGCGDGESFSDSTMVDLTIGDYDFYRDYNGYSNPRGVWTYGEMLPGDLTSFVRFAGNWDDNNPAVYANPGESCWSTDLDDIHPYRDYPHRENVLEEFKTTAPRGYSVFASEYGIGSAINLTRVVRGFEGLGRTDTGDARFFVNVLNSFMKDWNRLGMERTFASPDDYFDSAVGLMARCRLFGMNALRANPKLIGYSLTAGHDISCSGEGLVTYFREPKKGAHDAVFDGFSPCRWCAFVEPMNVRNTDKVKISGVLVNEDVLKPGEYRARVTVFGEGARLYDETIPVTVKANSDSFVADSFEAEVPINGAPEGTYKLKIVIAEGGHAVGEEEFYVYAPEKQRSGEVVLAGDDPALKSFLTARGLAVRDWKDRKGGEVIVASGAIEDLAAVMKAVEEGAKCVFLDGGAINEKPEVPGVGKFVHADMWLYHKDDTAMANHPFFKGLPTGLMDAFRYREVLRSFWWKGGATPDDLAAVGFNTSNGYGCGVTLGGYKHGAGMFYINALRIREEIGISPVAERILLNIIDALIA